MHERRTPWISTAGRVSFVFLGILCAAAGSAAGPDRRKHTYFPQHLASIAGRTFPIFYPFRRAGSGGFVQFLRDLAILLACRFYITTVERLLEMLDLCLCLTFTCAINHFAFRVLPDSFFC